MSHRDSLPKPVTSIEFRNRTGTYTKLSAIGGIDHGLHPRKGKNISLFGCHESRKCLYGGLFRSLTDHGASFDVCCFRLPRQLYPTLLAEHAPVRYGYVTSVRTTSPLVQEQS